ncbi:hypothetical protein BD626DRAFT_32967 [Schizophyllum amplum]|uniref:Uncharacterized protein n=1 Tax=Schizophyllum amplum TaxID=97359 RepID=A0A550CE69_9AGAR|nr:hypothetical protein BD626DRAFT_32967 [Auriculariopsis ampla]
MSCAMWAESGGRVSGRILRSRGGICPCGWVCRSCWCTNRCWRWAEVGGGGVEESADDAGARFQVGDVWACRDADGRAGAHGIRRLGAGAGRRRRRGTACASGKRTGVRNRERGHRRWLGRTRNLGLLGEMRVRARPGRCARRVTGPSLNK